MGREGRGVAFRVFGGKVFVYVCFYSYAFYFFFYISVFFHLFIFVFILYKLVFGYYFILFLRKVIQPIKTYWDDNYKVSVYLGQRLNRTEIWLIKMNRGINF